MISRRNYFAITTVMLIIFFLFQFTNVALENWDGYEENSFYQDKTELPDESSAYQAETGVTGSLSGSGSHNSRSRVAYIGSASGKENEVVHTWAVYTKKNTVSYESLDEFEEGEKDHFPEIVVVNSQDLNWKQKDISNRLERYVDEGMNLVFCNLPEAEVIKGNKRLQKLLGIARIKADQKDMEGIYLRNGFLLGGDAVYQAADQEEAKKRQDLELTMPWYALEAGTKIYMRGITGELEKAEEDYPAVIWRKRHDRAYVFAVNGDYMADVTGLGLLTAMMSDVEEYELYPVVNAQNMVILNYPEFASENDTKMEELYGQPLSAMLRDIAWPAVVATYRQNTLGLSCMLTPQYDYADDSVPRKKELQYYMRRLKEQGAEAGISGTSVSDTEIRRKLTEDQRIMQKELPDYLFSSFYTGSLTEEEIQAALQEELLKSVRTVISDYSGESDIIGYQANNITKQSILSDGLDHTYRADLRMRSIQTALGYSSVQMDMTRVAYPGDENDTLEKAISEFSGNIGYYWKNFQGFSGTTVSECDSRIRDFLALDYSESQVGDRIHLERTGSESSAWFILRVSDERITHVNVDGGSGKKLEEGAWLIEAEDSEVMIELE